LIYAKKQNNLKTLVARMSRLKKQGLKTVFAWGTFDLLHRGHIDYLNKARALGDYLIVGVYSDRVVKARNQPGRPMTPAKERIEILSAFTVVDAVILISEETAAHLIEKMASDIVVSCKVADPNMKEIIDRLGLRFVKIKRNASQSTTGIIQHIANAFPSKNQ
jgi:D-beta-D-heptose 7-phosphate kinase/D-beta-D-heptose 1-phosphate adenosyltransferase